VAQEALTNVMRHARAQTVSVEVDRALEVLYLVVRDDGIGFDVVTAQQSARFGTLGMRERVALLGVCWTASPRPVAAQKSACLFSGAIPTGRTGAKYPGTTGRLLMERPGIHDVAGLCAPRCGSGWCCRSGIRGLVVSV
jgi:hypothetical protein